MLELWKFEVYMTLYMLTADLITQMQKSQRKLQEVVNSISLEIVKHRLDNLLMGLLQIRLNDQVDIYYP